VCCLSSDDWSWRVRYVAVVGLIRVCQELSRDSLKDGIRAVAWNMLRKASSVEADVRVLEALKRLSIIEVYFCFNVYNFIHHHMVTTKLK